MLSIYIIHICNHVSFSNAMIVPVFLSGNTPRKMEFPALLHVSCL